MAGRRNTGCGERLSGCTRGRADRPATLRVEHRHRRTVCRLAAAARSPRGLPMPAPRRSAGRNRRRWRSPSSGSWCGDARTAACAGWRRRDGRFRRPPGAAAVWSLLRTEYRQNLDPGGSGGDHLEPVRDEASARPAGADGAGSARALAAGVDPGGIDRARIEPPGDQHGAGHGQHQRHHHRVDAVGQLGDQHQGRDRPGGGRRQHRAGGDDGVAAGRRARPQQRPDMAEQAAEQRAVGQGRGEQAAGGAAAEACRGRQGLQHEQRQQQRQADLVEKGLLDGILAVAEQLGKRDREEAERGEDDERRRQPGPPDGLAQVGPGDQPHISPPRRRRRAAQPGLPRRRPAAEKP